MSRRILGLASIDSAQGEQIYWTVCHCVQDKFAISISGKGFI